MTLAAVSQFVREKHIAGGFDPASIEVKHNFAWSEQRRSGSGEYFLYAGRFSEEKGVVPLVSSWGAEAPNLVVVGEGPEASQVRRYECGNIEVRPSVTAESMPDLVRGARAVIVPSLCYEGAPRSIVEAFAVGVPVIAPRSGAMPEFVEHGVSGCLVDHDDPSSYQRVAMTITRARSLTLGAGAHSAWVRLYSPGVAGEALERLYDVASARYRDAA